MLPSIVPWDGQQPARLTGGLYCISATMLQQVGLLPECRWTASLEEAYGDIRRQIKQRQSTDPDEQTPSSALTPGDLNFFVKFRFARLCEFLRRRRPDDHVGYSILLYHLSDNDLVQALQDNIQKVSPDHADNLLRLAWHSLRMGSPSATFVFFKHLEPKAQALPISDMLNLATGLGDSLAAASRSHDAVSVFRAGLRYDPENPVINNNLAWILATDISSELRDGEEALRRAQIAARALGRIPAVLDTLAAAYAELGQFEQAVICAKEAIHHLEQRGTTGPVKEISARLKGYIANQPYRQIRGN
jgi:tetratricopeptide (TPR) repeat protein